MKELIKNDSRFVSEVVFSGGEPLFQMEALIELSRYIKSLGLKVGLETSGFESHNALVLFNDQLLDFVYADFKTSPEKYQEVIGSKTAFRDLVGLMELCKKHRVPCELRTTNVPDLVNPETIVQIKNVADTYGFTFKLQEYRPND
jgi:pyruvate formate lyase activating enzyme